MSLWPLWWFWHPSEVWRALCAWDEYHQRKGDQGFHLGSIHHPFCYTNKINGIEMIHRYTDLVWSRFMLFSGSGSCSWPSSLVSPLSSGLNSYNSGEQKEKKFDKCCQGLSRCLCPPCESGVPTTWGQSSTSLTSSLPTGWIFFGRSCKNNCENFPGNYL